MTVELDIPIAPSEPAKAAGVLAPEDLAEVIQAYSVVAERLQASHEALQGEVVRLHEELANKNAQLERSKRLSALGEMAAGIAHEIRNPLAAIQLYVEMVGADLKDSGFAEEGQPLNLALDNTGKIAEAVRGLSAIVNDVLAFARQMQPIARPLDPQTVCQRIFDETRPLIEASGVEIKTVLEVSTLYADPDLLHRALVNLVRNAAEAMAGQPEARLTLAVAENRVTVADTGPGLPEDVIDRIFNPFFTTRNTGTGLGLAIVHRIVDAHGGSIAVHNDPQHGGAVFCLELPAAAADAPAAITLNSPAKDAA